MATMPKPKRERDLLMATRSKNPAQARLQEAAELRLQAAALVRQGQDDNDSDGDSEEGEEEEASLEAGVTLSAGNWYPVSLVKAIRYQFRDAKTAVRVKVGTYAAHLPLLPDWCQVVANEQGEVETVTPLAFAQSEKGAIVYQDKTAQAIYLTAVNAVKQAASLSCKVIDSTTNKPPKARQYADATALLAACKMVPPVDLADSWESWLATADRGGYARSCQDYTSLLAGIRKALLAAGISPAGAENTVRWFDLPGTMFSTSDKARLVDSFVAYPTKSPLSDSQRQAAQEKTLERMQEQVELHSESHPAGAAMLEGFIGAIKARLLQPVTVEDDTALD